MKKNFTMRTAAIVLALILATACLVSGTFAKYTMNVTGSDNARVAYFWFGSDSVDTIDVFGTADATEGDLTTDPNNADQDVIAPGTHGAFAFDYIGGAEVDTWVAVDLALTNDDNIPLVFKYDGKYYTDAFEDLGNIWVANLDETVTTLDNDNTPADDAAAAVLPNESAYVNIPIAGKIADMATAMSFEYKANTDISADYDSAVQWFWGYSDSKDGDPTADNYANVIARDAADTLLANAAYKALVDGDTSATVPTCELDITVTFTQID